MSTTRHAIVIFPSDAWGRPRGQRRAAESIQDARDAMIEALIDSPHHMASELVQWVEDGDIRLVTYKPLPTGGRRGKTFRTGRNGKVVQI